MVSDAFEGKRSTLLVLMFAAGASGAAANRPAVFKIRPHEHFPSNSSRSMQRQQLVYKAIWEEMQGEPRCTHEHTLSPARVILR